MVCFRRWPQTCGGPYEEGYGEEGFAPARLHREPYWVIKNSWGPGWGVDGYYKICKDKGSCGLNTMVVAAEA